MLHEWTTRRQKTSANLYGLDMVQLIIVISWLQLLQKPNFNRDREERQRQQQHFVEQEVSAELVMRLVALFYLFHGNRHQCQNFVNVVVINPTALRLHAQWRS